MARSSRAGTRGTAILRSRARGRASTSRAAFARTRDFAGVLRSIIMPSRLIFRAFVGCFGLFLSGRFVPLASAHAPAEVLQIVSSKPDALVIATNRGLIYGNLQTRAFALLCNQALDVGTSTAYRTAVLPSGKLLVGDSLGLRASMDRGCTFAAVSALAQLSVPSMVQDPSNPRRVFVTTSGTGEGGVRVSDDEGATFATLLKVPDEEFLGSLLIAKGDPARLYTAAVVLHKDTPTFTYSYYLSRSVDGGKTWTRADVALTDDERDVTLLAVNPVRPEELLARATASEPALGERVLWSNDGGETFSSPITLRSLHTATFSADGKTAYLGGLDGVWQATDDTRTFEQVADTARTSTLLGGSDGLLAAGYYKGIDARQDGVGVRGPSDTGFSRWFDFVEVDEMFSCPAPSSADARCRVEFRDWQVENPSLSADSDAGTQSGPGEAGVAPHDAGLTTQLDAQVSADAGGRPSRHDDNGGCSLVGPQAGNAGWLSALFLLWATLTLRGLRAQRLRCRVR
ncbi:MAG: hypothetical protein RLZZ450_1329 [Pseudomonadota bacterium]|jgi:hypothetical protein